MMFRYPVKPNEPVPPFTPVERIVDWLALMGMIGSVVLVAVGTMVIPEQIPVHFGVDGTPDRYGSRSELWALLVMMGLSFLLLWAPIRFIDRLRPCCYQDWVRDNGRQIQLVRSLMLWMSLEFAILVNLMIIGILDVAQFRAVTLDLRPVWLITGTVGVTLGVWVVAAVRERTRSVDRSNE